MYEDNELELDTDEDYCYNEWVKEQERRIADKEI